MMTPIINPLRNPVRIARRAEDVPRYFTRNSIAYTSDGIQVGVNMPRLEQGKFGKAVIIEEDTTNLVINEKDFTVWTKLRVTVTADAAMAPDGTLTADKIVCTGDNDPYILQTRNLGQALGGKTFTFSVWVWTDVGQPTEMMLLIGDNTLTYRTSQFFILTFAPRRYTVTYTFPTECSSTSIMYRLDLQQSFLPAGAYAYAWGAQLEQKPYATTFIDDIRAPETLTMPTANVLNPNEGTIEFWTQLPVLRPNGYQPFIEMDNLVMAREYSGADTNKVRVADGADVLISNVQLQVNNWYYITYTWSMTGRKLFINGSLAATSSKSAPIPLGANLNIGRWIDDYLDGYIDNLRISTRARSDAEIAEAYASGQPLPVDEWTTVK